MNIKNKKAQFDYYFLEEYDAGIMLLGTEVKSLRDNNASIKESYCAFDNGELFLYNMFIAEYVNGTYNNHEPYRRRKLLLTKKELKKLEEKKSEKGLTIVPYYMFDKNGKIKVRICLAKGKKQYDKRESIKERDIKRDMEREL